MITPHCSLYNNNLTDTGAIALARALQDNKSLEELRYVVNWGSYYYMVDDFRSTYFTKQALIRVWEIFMVLILMVSESGTCVLASCADKTLVCAYVALWFPNCMA